MTPRFSTVGKIVGSRLHNSGVIFEIETKDEAQRKLEWLCAINTRNAMALQIAQRQLVILLGAAGLDRIIDSEQLHGAEVIVDYKPDELGFNGFRVSQLRKVQIVAERIVYRKPKSWVRKLLDRFARDDEEDY